MKVYDPKKHNLGPEWFATIKLDGVQAIRKDGVWLSRAGKPLYNLPRGIVDGTYEVFLGSWDKTVSAVRTMDCADIKQEFLYRIDTKFIDPRLFIETNESLTEASIQALFEWARKKGHEGLVLHNHHTGEMLKVKDKVTYDVPVTGFQWGTGKHTGRMGALITPMGKVGTGFTDKERKEWALWYSYNSGNSIACKTLPERIIEVECMELTVEGKFRHPRFLRLREDKA